LAETIAGHGLFCSLYTDRGGHYFHTPVAGGKVNKDALQGNRSTGRGIPARCLL
jgi:hypothetical protein